MNWINVSEKMPQEEDGSYQLVVHLVPRFGLFAEEVTVASFDSPEDYEDPDDAEGWNDWKSGEKILVTHWMRLPSSPNSEFNGIDQQEFKRRFSSMRPNFGCVSEEI